MERVLDLVLQQARLPLLKKISLVSKKCYNLAINSLYRRIKIFSQLTKRYIKPKQKVYVINRTTREIVLVPRQRVPVILLGLLTPFKDIATKKSDSRWKLSDKFSVCTKYRPDFDTYNAILYL